MDAVNPEEAERRALENLKTHARRVAKEAICVEKPGGLVSAAIDWAKAEAAIPPAETRERIMRAALEAIAATAAHPGCKEPACHACRAGDALNAADCQDPLNRCGG